MRRPVPALALSALLGACSGAGSGSATPGASTPVTAPAEAEPAEVEAPVEAPLLEARVPATAGVEVHEVGFADVAETAHLRHPTLYFHHLAAVPVVVEVGIRVPGGVVQETFPTPTRSEPDGARWTATISSPGCRTPYLGDAPCTAPDGVCELGTLPGLDAASAGCVEVAGTRGGLVSYRARAAPTLPLRVARRDDQTVEVTATGLVTGRLLRITHPPDATWGTLLVARADVPERGATVTLPIGTERIDSGAGRRAGIDELTAALIGLGMDEDEAQAFVTAWTFVLFGRGGASGHSGPTEAVPDDAILYFVEGASADALSTLTVSPPASVRRAFLVRVTLPPLSH